MTESFLNILLNQKYSAEEARELMIKELLESKESEKDSLESSTYERDRYILGEQCRLDYGDDIWNKLSLQSKKDLKLAYFYEQFISKVEDDQTTPINKFTKTVENEIRQKLFIEYAKTFKDERLEIGDDADTIFDKFLDGLFKDKKATITLGQMLRMIQSSYYDSTKSNYSYELKTYIIDHKWDEKKFYSAKDKKFYIDYPVKYRNDSAHEYVFDANITRECKIITKEIITWFISSKND